MVVYVIVIIKSAFYMHKELGFAQVRVFMIILIWLIIDLLL
jgi:hypothetical protein